MKGFWKDATPPLILFLAVLMLCIGALIERARTEASWHARECELHFTQASDELDSLRVLARYHFCKLPEEK